MGDTIRYPNMGTVKKAAEIYGLSPVYIRRLCKEGKIRYVNSDASLLDFLSSDTDMENTVISQEWHKELHRILFEALADIPGEQCSLIVRHYFNGRTFRQLAEEYHTTPQTLYNWKEAAFRSIRTGKYGKALAEFSSSESGKRRADSLIKQDLNALKRLELSNKEKELLAL